jgi:RNA polymerase sigma factor (sigma-70 family)
MTSYEQLKNGGTAELQAFIQEHQKLVSIGVSAYLKKHPHLGYFKDDLRSAAQLGLAKAAARLKKRDKPDSIEGYIVKAIRGELRYAVDRDAPIYIPTSTKAEKKKEGEEIIPPKVGPLKYEPAVNPDRSNELLEELEAVCDKRDKKIIRLRIEGYTLEEIGERLSLTEQRVGQLIQELEARFDERCPEHIRRHRRSAE